MIYSSFKKLSSLLVGTLVVLGGIAVAAPMADAAPGSVVVTSSGDLRITGSSGSETIRISDGNGNDTSYDRVLVSISGVNGASEGVYEGVTRDIIVNTGGGGDGVLLFGDFDIPRHLTINFGRGGGTVESSTGEANGNVRILGGNQRLEVDLRFHKIEGDLEIRNGRAAAFGSFYGVEVDGRSKITAGGKLHVAAFDTHFDGGLTFTGSNYRDHLTLTRSRVTGRTTINLKGADDSMAMREGTKLNGPVIVRLGSGDDAAGLTDSQFNGSVNLAAQGGDDRVVVATSVFTHRSVVFNGNSGVDQLAGEFNVFATPPRAISFEVG